MAHKREFPITMWSCFYGTCLLVGTRQRHRQRHHAAASPHHERPLCK